MDKIEKLTDIILDKTARADEKDDAIVLLGSMNDKRALNVLVDIGRNEESDYMLKASAGESIARIMISTNVFDEKSVLPLTKVSLNELTNLITAQKPEWLNCLRDLGL
jgi:hypothetical protein